MQRYNKRENDRYSISQSAKLLQVTRQGYYYWLIAPTSIQELKHKFLTQQIHCVFLQHNENYGSPRIAQQLFDEGIQTNKRVVALLMQRARLVARGYQKRTKGYSKKKPLENILRKT